MKFKFLTATLAILNSIGAFAGNPDSAKIKPTREIQYWCEVLGVYQRQTLGDGGSLETCALISRNHCMYIPCTPQSTWTFSTRPVAVPPGVHIEDGQKFWARYDENGTLTIHYLDQLSAYETYDDNGNLIFVIQN